MEIVGLVPCAGKGSRLGLPFPKEMYPDIYSDSYRPIIMYTLEAMKLAGIKHIIFTINPNKTDLLKFLGNGSQFGMNFTFCIHPEPKSLPESINEAYHIINDKIVVFAMPDTVIQPKDFLCNMLNFYNLKTDFSVTLGCFKTDNPSKFGMVDYIDEKVNFIKDKPKQSSLEWMWGTMIWDSLFTSELNKFLISKKNLQCNKELCLTDALSNLISSGKVNMLKFEDGIYRDLGTYDEINTWSVNNKLNKNK